MDFLSHIVHLFQFLRQYFPGKAAVKLTEAEIEMIFTAALTAAGFLLPVFVPEHKQVGQQLFRDI